MYQTLNSAVPVPAKLTEIGYTRPVTKIVHTVKEITQNHKAVNDLPLISGTSPKLDPKFWD